MCLLVVAGEICFFFVVAKLWDGNAIHAHDTSQYVFSAPQT